MNFSTYQAGTTWSQTVELSGFPTNAWALKLFIRGPKMLDVVASIVNSSTYKLDIVPNTTIDWPSGKYTWQLFVQQLVGSERYIQESGVVDVVSDIGQFSEPQDFRSQAQITLDAIDATIRGVATKEQMMLKVGVLQLQYQSLEDLIKAREYYADIVARESNVGYGGFGQRMLVRFNKPNSGTGYGE